MNITLFCSLLLLSLISVCAAAPLEMKALTPSHRVWQPSEFALTGVPPAANPYDPDIIAVDASFTGPSGRSLTLPAFWYQDYTRALQDEREVLTPRGEAGWRVRWTPLESGAHRCVVTVTQGDKSTATGSATFEVGEKAGEARGFVRVEPQQKRYFQTDDGAPLPLLGENLCWPEKGKGTYDYDTWFAAFESAGMNYTRLWMWQTAFGVEFLGEERLNYNQQRAWQLDYVLDAAAQKQIFVMLCLDYHGIFNVQKDMWGGNNWWPLHAYNQTTGGPCATQAEFFTNEAAKSLYRKRLRYLVGRYASQPSLMSWQFFNEISNVYKYLEPEKVVKWHDEMGTWLHAHDPYRHLTTTSLGAGKNQRELWELTALDYTQFHWYGVPENNVQPAQMAQEKAQQFYQQYRKPMFVGEFGTRFTGSKAMVESDPQFRGLHQGLWGGIFGGSSGTAMTWWWNAIHEKNLYPMWKSLHDFLDGTGFGSAQWRPLEVSAPEADAPSLKMLGQTDGSLALVWVIDKAFVYPAGANAPATTVSDASVTLSGMPDGDYQAQWWDTRQGRVLGTTRASSRGGSMRLPIVPFSVDVAARVRPVAEKAP